MSAPEAQRPTREAAGGGVLGWLLADPAAAVYGTIVVGTVLAAESARRETYPKTIAAVVITLLLYWLAHGYAELAGQRLQFGGRLTAARTRTTMVHELSLLAGAALPLAAVLVCWVAGVDLSSAVTAAVWVDAAVLLAIEFTAALRARLSGLELLAQTLVGAMLGTLILALRIVLH